MISAVNRHSRALRSYALESEIERLLRDEQYELAVLVSQTLLELRVEAAMADLAEGFQAESFGEAAFGLLSSYNLTGRTQQFLEEVLDTKLHQELPEEMQALKDHIELRNAIAHSGAEASEQEARASYGAVLEVSERIRELIYRRIGWEAVLEEEERQRQEDEGIEEDE
jgi:hypothetical protein